MSRRLTRKQIKQDQFVSIVDEAAHWTASHWRVAAIAVGVIAGASLLWWGATAIASARGGAAARALGKALETYSAPIGETPAVPGGPSFATAEARLEAAEAAFGEVRSRYRLSRYARMARLYLARIAAERGDSERATRELAELASRRSDDMIVRLAMLDLVKLRLARGEGAQLAPDLEAMTAGRDPRLPRDLALYQLALVWEREGKIDEAARLYRKLTEDFPESPYRFEAQQRLSAIS